MLSISTRLKEKSQVLVYTQVSELLEKQDLGDYAACDKYTLCNLFQLA